MKCVKFLAIIVVANIRENEMYIISLLFTLIPVCTPSFCSGKIHLLESKLTLWLKLLSSIKMTRIDLSVLNFSLRSTLGSSSCDRGVIGIMTDVLRYDLSSC